MLKQVGGFLKTLKPSYDDSPTDRLNYIWTNIIIFFFAILIGAQQYVGEPLQCWVPAQFKGGWEQYVENYCFVENTYWVPVEKRLPDSHDDRARLELQYYQWIPFVLALQGLLFFLPRMIWQIMSGTSGLDVTAMIQSAFMTKTSGDYKALKADNSEALKIIAENFLQVKDYKNARTRTGPKIPIITTLNKGMGVYLTSAYIFSKLLWIVNVVCQFLILNSFLGPQYEWWGISILRDLMNGTEWESSGHFPRVTFCDFEVRRLGNLHRFSVQCVLMLNMFNEKIYLFLWFWFFIVAVVTCLDFIYWIVISVVPEFRKEFIRRYLQVKGKLVDDIHDYQKVQEFTSTVLRPDGVTLLRLIAGNAGDIVVADIVGILWDRSYLPVAEPIKED